MRFDDTLETVLAGDLTSPSGVQSVWRQLVDLIGRRRIGADSRALALLRRIRAEVPPPVRAASARGLEFADPPPQLVRLFALDELAIALPVLRSARMRSAEWIQLLPDLAPAGRSVLRNRRDLSPIVRRALEAYGPIDFVLPDESRRAVNESVVSFREWEAPVADLPRTESPAHAALVDTMARAEETETVPLPEPEPEPIAFEPELEPEPVAVADVAAEPEPEAISVEPEPEPAPMPVPTVSRAVPLERIIDWTDVLDSIGFEPAPAIVSEPVPAPAESPPAVPAAPEPAVEVEDLSFVALAGIAPALSVDAAPALPESQGQTGTIGAETNAEPIAPDAGDGQTPAMSGDVFHPDEAATALDPAHPVDEDGPFQIAEVVARIDAFWRNRDETGLEVTHRPSQPAQQFRFETDAKGVIRWVEGASRAPIVGLSLDFQGTAEGSRVDGVAVGAFRRRAGFSSARMVVEGDSDAAGDWLISAIPVFDPANGRFTGYRGTGRRPRSDERAEPVRAPSTAPDSLRQLVHELRTPTNAIAGFAEMIESQMLGPVSDPYRERAQVIRTQARELLGAIDDLDLAARIDSSALSLVPGRVALRPVLAAIADDLAPLATMRSSYIALPVDDFAVTGDRRAVERLLARLMATLVSASSEGERVGVRTALEGGDKVAIVIDRPRALADYPGDSVLGIDDEGGDATLLGTGFALRLARNLARELGGSLVIEAESLTLRLPASVNSQVGQAHLS